MKKYLILILLLCTSCAITGQAIGEQDKLSLRLPVPVYDATVSYFFTTLDQGYFEDEGLEVQINFGTSETNPVKMVATGADDIGVLGGPDTLLVARSTGLPLQTFAIMHQESNFPILIAREDSGIETVQDLQGSKIGFYYGHISTDVLRNLLRQEGIEYTEVDVGFDFSQVIVGTVDAQFGFWSHAPYHLASKGVDSVTISPSDYGITTHGYTLFSTEKTLLEKQDEITRFWKAMSRGIQYSIDNPEQAIQSIMVRDPNLVYDTELEKLKQVNQHIRSPIGYVDEDMLQDTYDRLEEENVIEKPFVVEEAFTDTIFQAIA